MQHLPTLVVMQRALRQDICRQCSFRPTNSESLGPDVPRACEPRCTIFIHLPRLRDIAARIHEPTLARYERAVRDLICEVSCEQSPTAGDYCGERTTMNCPLARYTRGVIDALERVSALKHRKAQ